MKETEFEYPGPKVLYSLSLYPFTKLLWLLTFFQFACCLPPDLSGNSLECTGQVLVGSIWYFGLVGVLGIFLIISQKWVLGTAVQSHLFPQSILCPVHSGLNISCLRFFLSNLHYFLAIPHFHPISLRNHKLSWAVTTQVIYHLFPCKIIYLPSVLYGWYVHIHILGQTLHQVLYLISSRALSDIVPVISPLLHQFPL